MIEQINFDDEGFYIDDNMPQWKGFIDGSSLLRDSWEKLVGKIIIENIKKAWSFAEIGDSFGGFTFLVAKRTEGK